MFNCNAAIGLHDIFSLSAEKNQFVDDENKIKENKTTSD